MRIFMSALLVCTLMLSGCSSQQKAQDVSNVISGILSIGQAEENALPAKDAAIITPWINLGASLVSQLNGCIASVGTLAKKSAFVSCFNTFAGGLLSPTELSQLRILSASSQSKVQLWATAIILGVNAGLAAFGGNPQPLPAISPAAVSTANFYDMCTQLAARGVPCTQNELSGYVGVVIQ